MESLLVTKIIIKYNWKIEFRLLCKSFRNCWWYIMTKYDKYDDRELSKFIFDYESEKHYINQILLENIKYIPLYKNKFHDIFSFKEFNKFIDLNNYKFDFYNIVLYCNFALKKKIIKKIGLNNIIFMNSFEYNNG